MKNGIVVEGLDLQKRFPLGESEVIAIDSIPRLAIRRGESVALLGRSGSGKSSLLHILGGLERPTTGAVQIDGASLYEVDEKSRARLRAERIGFVFQAFHLVEELTALDNVELVMRYVTRPKPVVERRRTATELLGRVGLGHRLGHRVTRLSGGERQRVAIARALANDPLLIIADEPTGNLDSATGEAVLDLLLGLAGERRTVLMATHSIQVAARCQRRITMIDGRIEEKAMETSVKDLHNLEMASKTTMRLKTQDVGEAVKAETEKEKQTPVVIQAEDLVKSYKKAFGKKVTVAVDRVSFTVHRGEIFGFLGPNGSGKTTTIKMLCGLVLPSAGRAAVDGLDVACHRSAVAERIGGVLEGNRNLYWRLSALENMAYYAEVRGIPFRRLRSRAMELLAMFGLEDRKNDPVRHYSRGMQQRLALAVSLLTDPQVLLLDEPTLGLDVDSTRIMVAQIKKLAADDKKTIFLTTHQMTVAQELCDRLAIMKKGKIVREGSMDHLLRAGEPATCRVTFIAPEEGIAALPNLLPPGVQFRRENGYFLTEGNETTSPDIYRLFTALQAAGATLLDLRCQGNDLESVYLSMLKEDHHAEN